MTGPTTLAALVDRGRGVEGTALRTGEGRSYDYGRFVRSAAKAGNFLHLHGADRGARVAVVAAPVPEPVLAFFGAVLAGAVVRFDPPRATDADLLVAPTGAVGDHDLPDGAGRVEYGEQPDDPAVAHFERGAWSENPAFPPRDRSPGEAVLAAGGTYTHADLLDAAREVITEHGLDAGDAVALRAGLGDPSAVAAGIVAPLLAGATIVLDPAGVADVAVAAGDAPEDRAVDPGDVPL